MSSIPLPPSPQHLIALADGSSRSLPLITAALLGAAMTGLAAAAVVGPPEIRVARPLAERVAPLARPTLVLAAPSRLREGDLVEAEVRLTGEGVEALAVEATSADAAVEVGTPRPMGFEGAGTFLWVVPLAARAPGDARVRVQAGDTRPAEVAIRIVPAGRQVTLVTNVEVGGPEGTARVELDARARDLTAPRALDVRTLPGLTAEVQLGLEGLAHMPHGCFEQTTAATYPSVLVLELAQVQDDVSPELVAEARACAQAGAARLELFQLEDGAFCIFPGQPADPWLTAVGLEERTLLARALGLDAARTKAAAAALVARWQEESGAFLAEGRAMSAGRVVITAYAAAALQAAGEQPEAAAEALAWLAAHAREAWRTPYELALTARALLRHPEHAPLGRELATLIGTRARRGEDGLVSWEPTASTTTGSDGRASAVEVTALCAQVLIDTGLELQLATDALRWLSARRTEHGFGGTQATVQTLRAFHAGQALRRPGQGLLEVELGGWTAAPIAIEPAAALTRHPLASGAAGEVSIGRAVTDGVAVRFVGAGRVGAQLVLTGVVPWEDERWAAGDHEVQGLALRVRTQRPTSGRVGEPQRWVVHLDNATQRAVRDPLVEVGLPPGFVLHEGEGGLRALLDARVVLQWELRVDRLVLYVRDLAAGEELQLPVLLEPTLAGDFTAGHLHAQPYYRPGEGSGVGPGQVRVLPPIERKPVLPPRPLKKVPPAKPSTRAVAGAAEEPCAATAVAPEEDEAAAAKKVTIAWDPALGPLDLKAAELPGGATPLARLVARALFRGLPSAGDVVVVERDRVFEFFLDPTRRWSDDRAVTVDDYLAAWAEARARAASFAVDLQVDPVQLRLLETLVAEPLGPYRLRVRLPEPLPGALARLDAWPFLPRAPFADPDGELITNGAYRVVVAEGDRLVLRGEAGVVEVRAGGESALRWTDPAAREGVVALGEVSLNGHEVPQDAGWLPLKREDDTVLSGQRAVTRTDDPRLGSLVVRRDDGPAAAFLPSHLASASPLDAGRVLDRSGFLRYPPGR